MSSPQTQPGAGASEEHLTKIALRLANDRFTVQRGVRADPYVLDILASQVRPPGGQYAPIPWSTIVAVSSMNVSIAENVRDFSSFVAKYALDNRTSLGAFRMDMTTIAAVVASSFNDYTKEWVADTRPLGSLLKDRTEFPVLVELNSRSIIYYEKTPFRAGLLFRQLRKFCDKWFGFQP